jgi:uncharacterized protein
MNEEHLLSIMRQRKDYKPRTKHWNESGQPKYTNSLIECYSPYLLQHAHNPVNWKPWTHAILAEAQNLNKPIFLSIGYSTCHWCHVMERESFEDEEIAEWINRFFIPIKVDREERPDIDAIYMDFVQITTGKGGWPMTVFLAPNQRPLFAGTYFPPRNGDRGIDVGLLSYLKIMAKNWEDPKLWEQSDEAIKVLKTYAVQAPSQQLSPDWLQEATETWINNFDEDWGGFTAPPKFPRPVMLEAILRAWHRTGDARYLKSVEITLERMYCGGIYDHVGGGFARYSVDNRWWIPHFEKMLYDNAQLIQIYLEVYQVTRRNFYANVARDIMRYLIKEMKSTQGGLYSASDAESLDQDGNLIEGFFYTWTYQELSHLLSKEELQWVCATYGVTEEGNFEGHRSVLRLYEPLTEEEEAYWHPLRARLYQARAKRIPPLVDDKVICSWNALALSAFIKAAAILGEKEWSEHAQDIADHLLADLWDGLTLKRVIRGSQTIQHEGVLEDYMGFSCALLDLFEVTGSVRYLKASQAIYESAERFFDPERGGFFRCSQDQPSLAFQEKPLIDGAEPSGNALAALTALKLHHITDEPHYRAQADSTLRAIGSLMSKQAVACPKALAVLSRWFESRSQILLIHLPIGESNLTHPLTRTGWQSFQPFTVRLTLRQIDQAIQSHVPALKGKVIETDEAYAVICSSRGCSAPIHDPNLLRSALTKIS